MAEFFKSVASLYFSMQIGNSSFEFVPGLDIFNEAQKCISCHMIILFGVSLNGCLTATALNIQGKADCLPEINHL